MGIVVFAAITLVAGNPVSVLCACLVCGDRVLHYSDFALELVVGCDAQIRGEGHTDNPTVAILASLSTWVASLVGAARVESHEEADVVASPRRWLEECARVVVVI
jgi:hypothetical protein